MGLTKQKLIYNSDTTIHLCHGQTLCIKLMQNAQLSRASPHAQISVVLNYFTLDVRFVLLSNWIATDGKLIGVYWLVRRVTGRPIYRTVYIFFWHLITNVYFDNLFWFNSSNCGCSDLNHFSSSVTLDSPAQSLFSTQTKPELILHPGWYSLSFNENITKATSCAPPAYWI